MSYKELRDVFDQWNKEEENHCLSWVAFHKSYSTTSDIRDIRKPDDMRPLRLDPVEQFDFLLDVPEGITGNVIDYCMRQLSISEETIARNEMMNEEARGRIEILSFLISTKKKHIASKTRVIAVKMTEIDMHKATIEQTKRLDKDPDDIRADIKRLDNDIKRLDNDIKRLDDDIDDIRADIKRLDNDIKQRTNDSDSLREGNRRMQSVQLGNLMALGKLGHCSCDYTFTNVFSIGMVGRDKELYAVLEKLAEGSGTAVKEDNRPIAILSAPRQGKSLFLQAILSLLCPSIKNRPISKEDFNPPTLPKDVVVIPLTLNGTSAEVPKMNKESATAAANFLWNKAFGLSSSKSIVSGEHAAWLLGRLFPRRQVVLLVDELSKLVEDFRTDEKELQEFARLILSFFGKHTTMVFTGFDVKLSSAFVSASGRLPTHVTLDPIPLNTPSFLELLPLRNLLTSMSFFIRERAPEEASNLLLYYELGKSTPGVLGAIAQQKKVPILDMLEKKKLPVEDLILEYAVKRAEGSTVRPTDTLGERLLNVKIGVLLCDDSVYIPPIFVYAACKTNSTGFPAAFNQVVSVVKKWLDLYLPTGDEVATLINEASAAFELFVLASLRMQDTLLRPHNAHTYPEIDFIKNFESRLRHRYPAQPLSSGESVSGTWLTADSVEAVDIVRVVDDTRQQWVEVKMVSYRPDISTLVSAAEKHVKNVPAGVTSVEYVIVTPVPSRARRGELPLLNAMEDRKKELRSLLGGDKDVCVNGRIVKLTKRIVFMNTSDADTFLSPLVSTIAPSLGAMNGDTCESRLFVGSMGPDWMAVKDEKEIDDSTLDTETRSRLPFIRKRCELAIQQAKTLQTKY